MSRIRANTITNQNAIGAPNFPDGITVTGVVTSTTINANVTGDLTVTGNIGVGGTITYEDVTNIDSVGVVTARSGIKIGPTAGVAGTFFADGSYVTAGIITATSFSGSGSGLTGVDPSATASSDGFLKVLNATTPQIRLSNNASDNDDQQRSFFGIATGTNNFLTGSAANDTVLRARAGGDLIIGVGSTVRMKIDELGRVTKPSNPCFSAYNSNTVAANTTAVFDQVTVNVGSHYNASNGRFTAPVSANYFIIFHGMSVGSTSDNFRLTFKINGNNHAAGEYHGGVAYGGNDGGGYKQMCMQSVLYLTAGDYVTLFVNNAYAAMHDSHSKFSGFLLS